ncbi:ImmA/IrrE family metallo-endopeptidase [Agrilactobacillus fermenti]|uniref:ImmA/IrrE family metallo-endopeptidase n=1 Tax=Agrilactobacillus fermenti TaxID=2586909 RepID=UPI003A5C72F2
MVDASLIPIFETIDNENLNSPFAVAAYYDVNIKYAPFPKNVLGLSEPHSRTIFINEDSDQKYFVCGHEVIHTLLDEEVAPLLNTPYTFNSHIEHRADIGSFYMLLKMGQSEMAYEDGGTITIPNFLRHFNINSKYYYELESFFKNYVK